MNLVWSVIVIVAVAALAVTAMLLVRRSAPEGSRFTDGDRASGVFGVLATGFSVLLGFVVFLAFESYDQSRSGAETEALVLSQQVETAQFLPAVRRREAHGRAGVLRALGHPHRMAARGVGTSRGTRSTRGASGCSARSRPFSRRRRARKRPTESGSIRRPTARRRGSTGSTEPWA